MRRACLQDKQHVVERYPPLQSKNNRRIPWVAVLVVATVGLAVVAVCTVVSYRSFTVAPTSGITDDSRSSEVEEFIRRYFRTWSSQDMKGYGECFLENSTIQFIDSEGKVEQFALPAFLANQGEILRAGQNQNEVPESIDIRFESNLARVVVYWKLTVGPREVFGYDHFTLLKRNGKWGIVNLVFYETKQSG